MTVKPTILLSVQLPTQLNELLRVARLLKRHGAYHPVFCLESGSQAQYTRMAQRCQEEGVDVVAWHALANDPGCWGRGVKGWVLVLEAALERVCQVATTWLAKRWSRVCDSSSTWHADVVDYWRWRAHYRQGQWRASQLVRQYPGLCLLVVAEDGVGGNLTLIQAARQCKIPVLAVPYEYSTAVQTVQAHLAEPDWSRQFGLASDLNRWIIRRFPHWVHHTQGQVLLRLNGARILALEMLGLGVPLPWTVHGGLADCLAVESSRMYAHYQAEGLQADKLAVTGALYHDDLHAAARAEQALGNRGAETALPTRILCALPPDYTQSRADYTAYPDYEALLHDWVTTLLSVPHVTVTVQAHPAIAPEQLHSLSAWGVCLSAENITTLIPQHDVLVTSVSSIIRMAIACGKPVLNGDVYGFAYPDYQDVPGVWTVSTREAFHAAVQRLTQDVSCYTAMRDRQRASAAGWGMLDGRAGDRLCTLIECMASPVYRWARDRMWVRMAMHSPEGWNAAGRSNQAG